MTGFMEYKIKASGKHLILDTWGCKLKLDHEFILDLCEGAAIETGATILFSHSHPFDPEGSSGCVILAESHISFHHFPEEDNYIAFDIFVCGDCDPVKGSQYIKKILNPTQYSENLIIRGIR